MPLDLEFIRSARPQNRFHYFPTIGSTMTEASRLAQDGAPHGTVVLADEQVAGIGRQGRRWQSQSEVGLYSSTLLRLPLTPANLPVASLLIGLAVARAIRQATDVLCDLRWPNDVLIGERKVAGILPHLVSGCIVAGIGINVNNQSFDEDLRTPATSLALVCGKLISRETLLVNLLQALDEFCQRLLEEGAPSILDSFCQASTYAKGRLVTVEDSGRRGVTAGLDESGFLLLQTDRGSVERILSGGVRPAA